ncbi:N-acetylglucosamine-6-phosphate deacetylase [Lachnospiraceae bacterium LCP25S3_G4]
MIIKNVHIFTQNNYFEFGDLLIENGVFVSEFSNPESAKEVIDGKGAYAIPGLVDIHFHGCMGHDFCDGTVEDIDEIAKYEASVGVTSMAPATMTLAEDTLLTIMQAASAYQNKEGAKLVGINMEGPFICEAKKGAQAADYIRFCDIEMFQRLQSASGNLVKLVDIAPEETGAMEFIKALKDDVVISLAHTGANYDIAKEAYDTGAKHATHLYNAMPPFTHREPGVVGAARDSQHCMVELICDGIHVHPSMVRATFEMFGHDRIVMISDSMRATGMPDGRYTLGGQDVDVIGNRATLTSNGALAGSATNLMDCLRVAVKQMGLPLETVIPCCTINPAKAIGIDQQCGSISYGKLGHVVLLDTDLHLQQVIM